MVLLIATIAGLLYMAYRTSDGDESVASEDPAALQSNSEQDSAAGSQADDPPGEGDSASADSADQGKEATATDGDTGNGQGTLVVGGPSAPIPPPDEGPYVAATLNIDAAPGEGLFLLSGRVPNQQIADQVRQAAELSYAPFVESELEVDESLPAAEWLAVAPRVIGLL
ncbi:MAG: hypothetical protein OER95_19620, partial [Acidimicrobiia bacterium]|nr:hypothetical protein [Acidimicrobiia bacterium]